MVQLDDIGVDFTTIDEYELFLLFFRFLQGKDTSILMDGVSLNELRTAAKEDDGSVVLLDQSGEVAIDRAIHRRIADTFRKIHHLQKNTKRPGNSAAKDFMIERARKKMKRNRKPAGSQLEEQIVALVNTEQFSYGYDTVQKLTIYQFNESLYQIIAKIDYDNKMRGIYAGTVDATKLSQDELNWLTHK